MKGLKELGWLVGGVLLGTAGKTILTSKDAKKVYTHCTAAVLRGKDCIMETGTVLRENCEDIYADANDINELRYDEEEKQLVADAEAILEAYKEKEDAE